MNFDGLMHAYGAATDTAGHLAALTGDDTAAREAALGHLWSAIIHQGTPWTATPPAALEVAALIGDPRITDPELRADLLKFLAAVAEAARSVSDDDLAAMAAPPGLDVDAVLAQGDDEDIWEDVAITDALYARAVLGCREIVPTLLAAAIAALADPAPPVRAAAAHAIGACGGGDASGLEAAHLEGAHSEAAHSEGAHLEAAHLDDLARAAGPDERAALVLAIGAIGRAPRRYLDDPHPGVRACAALAPALAGDPRATDELLAALTDPAATDDWFTQRPPQLHSRIRFALIGALIDRVGDPDRLLPAALAIAPIATAHTVDSDWGPLLRALFRGYTGGPLTTAQRRYLTALTENANLWNPTHGNASLLYHEVGLPYDRDECRTLASA